MINHKYTTNNKLITSKDILTKTGLSRATLNNYIKLGILPKPLVRKPFSGLPRTKKIGYFPEHVLDRLDTVKIMKGEGYTIGEIARRLNQETAKPQVGPTENWESTNKLKEAGDSGVKFQDKEELKLTFEELTHPAYLINNVFEVIWVNEAAEKDVFKQRVSRISEGISRNIFKLFFHWELNSLVKNWKDLISFHMGFAKAKFLSGWITKMYKGTSDREAAVLSELHKKALNVPSDQAIVSRPVFFLNNNDTTVIFRVYVIFCREGILFVYVPEESF